MRQLHLISSPFKWNEALCQCAVRKCYFNLLGSRNDFWAQRANCHGRQSTRCCRIQETTSEGMVLSVQCFPMCAMFIGLPSSKMLINVFLPTPFTIIHALIRDFGNPSQPDQCMVISDSSHVIWPSPSSLQLGQVVKSHGWAVFLQSLSCVRPLFSSRGCTHATTGIIPLVALVKLYCPLTVTHSSEWGHGATAHNTHVCSMVIWCLED